MVVGQIGELSKTHRVELFFWKTSLKQALRKLRTSYPDPFPPDVKVIHVPARRERFLFSRAWRVFRSLFARYSSVEEVYFPEVARPRDLEIADLEIYHASLCLRWLERDFFPRAVKRICHFHNIEASLFRQRAVAETNIIKRWILNRFARKLALNEKRIGELVDETWFVSRVDLQDAVTHYQVPNPKLMTPTFSPTLRASRQLMRAQHSRGPILKVALLGALDFKPNEDSALFMMETVCPELERKGVPCEIWIAGKRPSSRLRKTASKFKFVKVLGFVEDIESFWSEIDCMVVPHVSGSGVRIKLLEALASGVSVIANPEAVAPLSDEVRRDPLLQVSELADFGNTLEIMAQPSPLLEMRKAQNSRSRSEQPTALFS